MRRKLQLAKKGFRRNWIFYVLPVPGLICLALFCYLPMAGIYLAFERYTYAGGLFGSEFVGLDNFIVFFNNIDTALRATRNTIVLNVFGIFAGIVFEVAFAIIMSEINSNLFKKFTQTITIFPHFISWIVIGTLSISLFHEDTGILNQLIQSLGADPVKWYSNPWYWWPILIITSIWKTTGYGSLVYYAAIMGFDVELNEAATIDGATRIQRIMRITVPQLIPTVVIMFLLSIGGLLNSSMDNIMGMTRMNPLLLETTDTIATYIYRSAIVNGQFEAASAVSLYQSVFGFCLVMISNKLVKKVQPDYALF